MTSNYLWVLLVCRLFHNYCDIFVPMTSSLTWYYFSYVQKDRQDISCVNIWWESKYLMQTLGGFKVSLFYVRCSTFQFRFALPRKLQDKLDKDHKVTKTRVHLVKYSDLISILWELIQKQSGKKAPTTFIGVHSDPAHFSR